LKNPSLKPIYRGALLIGLGYILLTAVIFLFQDKLIFQGDTLATNYQYNFEQPFEEVMINGRDGNDIHGLIFTPASGQAKGTMLYFHGNADNLQRWGNYAVDFTSLGYKVLIIDYAGYGKSTGSPSEDVLYQNAEDTWQWAQQNLPDTNLVIYGRSLGTAVAAHLAMLHQPNQLILETPFYELKQDHLSIFFPFGLNHKFANYKYLPQVKCPITIIQGTNDWVVTYSSAQKLVPLLKPKDRFITIEGGGHKNLREFDKYHIELARAPDQ